MGMAASQARYLGLTARKTNVEYEGQQVNQARTALANECANTFNELLKLEVPTAPSTQDFTTIKYSYSDGTNKESITSMSEIKNDPDGYNYMITHFHYADVYTGIKSFKSNPQVSFSTKSGKSIVNKSNITYDSGTDQFTITDGTNSYIPTQYDPTNDAQKEVYAQVVTDYPEFAKKDITDVYTYTNADGKIFITAKTDLSNAASGASDLAQYSIVEDVPSYVGNSPVLPYDPTDPDQVSAYKQICSDFPAEPIASTPNVYTWQYQGERYFATYNDLKTVSKSGKDQSKPTENQSKLLTYCAKDVNTKVTQTQKAFVEKDASGRFQSIRYEDSTATYPLITETETDEAAYQDAMNKYNYNMQKYEKAIADINAKTEKIQEQDRTLELRLRQLDTEQEALQTEMEAVKKVIDKNIESTFKTFE